MNITIDVRGITPDVPIESIIIGEREVGSTVRMNTALPEVHVYGVPPDKRIELEIDLLKEKLYKVVVEHFAEIEKERIEEVIKSFFWPKPINENDLASIVEAINRETQTKGNK